LKRLLVVWVRLFGEISCAKLNQLSEVTPGKRCSAELTIEFGLASPAHSPKLDIPL
jgi:hypothetical protein